MVDTVIPIAKGMIISLVKKKIRTAFKKYFLVANKPLIKWEKQFWMQFNMS